MLRIPHCLDSRLTDGVRSASPAGRALLPINIFISVFGSHFSLDAE
jgi:hypothetical protein